MADEVLELLDIAFGTVFGQHRDEGGSKGPLGEQSPEKIRDLERHEEGVREGVGPKNLRVDQVADEAEHPGEQRIPTDR